MTRPKAVTVPVLRAIIPSSQSVDAASTNRMTARLSEFGLSEMSAEKKNGITSSLSTVMMLATV
jgi:hypothetical protein